MTLKTTLVTGTLYRPDGTPAARVKGTARLTRQEIDDGIVVPSLVTIETDDEGNVISSTPQTVARIPHAWSGWPTP